MHRTGITLDIHIKLYYLSLLIIRNIYNLIYTGLACCWVKKIKNWATIVVLDMFTYLYFMQLKDGLAPPKKKNYM